MLQVDRIKMTKTKPRKKPNPRLNSRFYLLIAASVLIFIGAVYGISKKDFKHTPANLPTSSESTLDQPLKNQTQNYTPKATDSTNALSIPAVPSYTHDDTIPPVSNGLAPVISTIATKEKVVFLGIDDGANKQSFELQLMRANGIKASLFLADRFINDNPLFFKPFIDEGSLIEDHTMDHKLLPNLSYDQQKQEICDEADLFAQTYGRRPILFRPPGGSYNIDTQKAAAACGMKAVVLWIAKANGGSMQYQIGHSLRPGDIVLMHFRPEFSSDMQAFLDAEKAAGLHTELLEDWIRP